MAGPTWEYDGYQAERERLRESLPGETGRWAEVAHTLHVPWRDGVISQFAGYGDLAELDWGGYRERYGDIRRPDPILEAEGDTANRYRASSRPTC